MPAGKTAGKGGRTANKGGRIAGKARDRMKRTKGIEADIEDDLDRKIYSMFSVDELKLPKDEFNEVADDRRSTLAPDELERLTKIRRVRLSRFYSERNRQQRVARMQQCERDIVSTRKENQMLRERIATLSSSLEFLKSQFEHLRNTSAYDMPFSLDE